MIENHDLEIYMATGKLPPCFYCHKKDGVKAKLNFNWDGEAYLVNLSINNPKDNEEKHGKVRRK